MAVDLGNVRRITVSLNSGNHTLKARYLGSEGFAPAVSDPVTWALIRNRKPAGTLKVKDGILTGTAWDANRPDESLQCFVSVTTATSDVRGDSVLADQYSPKLPGNHRMSYSLNGLSPGRYWIEVWTADIEVQTDVRVFRKLITIR